MPSTKDTGGKPAPRQQTARKRPAKPKPAAAPAAAVPTPPPAPNGESMFDDAPPAPPAAERAPVERAAPSEPPAAPAEAISAEARGDAAQADPVPPAPPAPGPAPAGEGTEERKEPSGSPTRVRLGRVDGALHRVPLELVQELVAESGSRIATLQSSPTINDLQDRMRATEGRCAPIIFTMAAGDDVPRLFAGVEAVAAAINLGLPTVFVVTIDAGDAGAAQSHLAGRAYHLPAGSQAGLLDFLE